MTSGNLHDVVLFICLFAVWIVCARSAAQLIHVYSSLPWSRGAPFRGSSLSRLSSALAVQFEYIYHSKFRYANSRWLTRSDWLAASGLNEPRDRADVIITTTR